MRGQEAMCIEHWYGLQMSLFTCVVISATPPRSTRATFKPIQRIVSHTSAYGLSASVRNTSTRGGGHGRGPRLALWFSTRGQNRAAALTLLAPSTLRYSDTAIQRYIVSDVSPPLCTCSPVGTL